jgi:DNA-binding NtrC family response regulator
MLDLRPTVLMIDDNEDMRWIVRRIGSKAGFDVAEAVNGGHGLEIVAGGVPAADAVLLEMRLPDCGGEEMLHRLQQLDQHLPVIALTAEGSISGAPKAAKTGAFEYLTKPFRDEQLAAAVRRAIAHRQAHRETIDGGLATMLAAVMGHSAAIRRLGNQLEAVLATDYSVLVLGETGAGKEVVARALHERGPRRAKPFVAVDCGALTDSLVASELFGHERGAFTGAHARRRGRFELAAGGGTLFLDEIGNLSSLAQRTLLRALEERAVYRIGGSAPIRVDLRIIAATAEDLRQRVAAGSFRADLYFRLAEYTVDIPPLRSRPADIEFIARRFLAEACKGLGKAPPDFTPAALDLLQRHDWPGNARELRNVMRRAALAATGAVAPRHLAGCLDGYTAAAIGPPTASVLRLHGGMRDRVRDVERGAILDALAQAGGNKAAAARLLGIDYKTFRTKLKGFSGSRPIADRLHA